MTVLEMMPAGRDLTVHVEQQEDLAGGLAAAVFDSPARTYRYLLTRIWDPAVPPAVFVMLNPSTADALAEDPTIRRLAGPNGFARKLRVDGRKLRAGGLVVVNLFAVCSTDPRILRDHPDPVGPLNNAFIRQATDRARVVVAAWGAAGVEHGRSTDVVRALAARGVRLQCLGMTATRQPRHPLYLPGDAVLEPYGAIA